MLIRTASPIREDVVGKFVLTGYVSDKQVYQAYRINVALALYQVTYLGLFVHGHINNNEAVRPW